MTSTKNRTLALVLLVSLLLTAVPARAQQGGPVYLIQAGDTLSAIARTFGTTVEALMSANGLTNAAAIQPGQSLVVPGFEGISGTLTTRPVGLGDNLDGLAFELASPAEALGRLNRMLHPERLYVGQSFIRAEQAGAAPASTVKQVGEGLGPVEWAASRGLNPWRLRPVAAADLRLWLVPGELVAGPPAEGEVGGSLPAPLADLELSPAPAAQGQTLVLAAEATAEVVLSGSFDGRPLNFMRADDGSWVALQGVHALTEPGLYDIAVSLQPASGEWTYAFSQPFPVRSGGYGFDPVLFVPEETVGPENTRPEDARIAELVRPATEIKRWQGAFAYPSNFFTESFPSVFGTRRNYNNTGYNAYHTGLDFYGGVGVPIVAPAPGRVVFAGELTVRGWTTIIDHGWGVYTLYLHQSEILVEAGQEVETGETIGLVGASGRVTGPHLHWEVQVGGVPVEPLDWLELTYP